MLKAFLQKGGDFVWHPSPLVQGNLDDSANQQHQIEQGLEQHEQARLFASSAFPVILHQPLPGAQSYPMRIIGSPGPSFQSLAQAPALISSTRREQHLMPQQPLPQQIPPPGPSAGTSSAGKKVCLVSPIAGMQSFENRVQENMLVEAINQNNVSLSRSQETTSDRRPNLAEIADHASATSSASLALMSEIGRLARLDNNSTRRQISTSDDSHIKPNSRQEWWGSFRPP
ncbi:hypothetical protein R1flu_002461 [Riccia fluitans]|uniref:Uncharacterized protein n=1 Tax=Riccia fluitans TaxID=41844 RepID=A0ABD1Y6A0_9MARC